VRQKSPPYSGRVSSNSPWPLRFDVAKRWPPLYPRSVATVAFTQNLRRHIGSDLPPVPVDAATVGDALAQVFVEHPRLRGYVLDDQGAVRKHVVVFLDGETIADRATLSDPVPPGGELFISQALSGG